MDNRLLASVDFSLSQTSALQSTEPGHESVVTVDTELNSSLLHGCEILENYTQSHSMQKLQLSGFTCD